MKKIAVLPKNIYIYITYKIFQILYYFISILGRVVGIPIGLINEVTNRPHHPLPLHITPNTPTGGILSNNSQGDWRRFTSVALIIPKNELFYLKKPLMQINQSVDWFQEAVKFLKRWTFFSVFHNLLLHTYLACTHF